MDGNGRWAQNRFRPRLYGHRAGANTLRDIVEACGELGVEVLTVYAFSTENWKRPDEEVTGLMNLLAEFIESEVPKLNENNVRLMTIGALEDLPPEARRKVEWGLDQTRGNDGLKLVVALNYGGRQEILKAVRKFALEAAGSGSLEIDEEVFGRKLFTAGLPDPDLLIRTGGEQRISNFLLWQIAYCEFWFTEVLWPDFTRRDLYRAIEAYQRRERRFGGLGRC